MEEKKEKKAKAEAAQGPVKLAVRYVGRKPTMPINFPIGAKTLGAIHRTISVSQGGTVEMDEDEAHRLVALDSQNFALPEGVECKYQKSDLVGRKRGAAGEPKLSVPDGVREYTPEGKKKR